MALTACMTPAESGPKKVFTVGDESVTLAQLNAAGYVAPYGDICFMTTEALTAPRAIALPAISTMCPGAKVELLDTAGGCGATNKMTLTLAGSDQYQGAGTSPSVAAANGTLKIATNGTQWNAA